MRFNKLINLEKIVKEILEKDSLAREDDNYLILLVIEKTNPELAGETFAKVMLNAKTKGISMESITRARRKIQRKYPDLKNKETAEIREIEQKEYIDFSRG